jgi:hypothetical protein
MSIGSKAKSSKSFVRPTRSSSVWSMPRISQWGAAMIQWILLANPIQSPFSSHQPATVPIRANVVNSWGPSTRKLSRSEPFLAATRAREADYLACLGWNSTTNIRLLLSRPLMTLKRLKMYMLRMLIATLKLY